MRHQNINIVIEAMKSWVNNNPEGKTTSLIGHTALFLKDKIWEESERQYGLYDDTIYIAINNIIILTANEMSSLGFDKKTGTAVVILSNLPPRYHIFTTVMKITPISELGE